MCNRDLKTGLMVQLFVLLLASNGSAIERITAVGAREAALSLAVVALPTPFSIFHNQALLTEYSHPAASICYRQPYSINGYNESALSLVFPIPTAVLAVALSQASVGSYKESGVGLSIAKLLTRKLSAGVLFNYFFINFPEEGRQKGSMQVDGGVRYRNSDRLSLGLHLRNVAASKVETYQNKIIFPLVVRGGASYWLTAKILLTGEAIFEKNFGVSFRYGAEFKLLDNFLVRGGISTNPFLHSFGFGYCWRFCQLDFALVHHALLGFSPLLSFNFNLHK